MSLETRRWFNQTQPQTMQIAVILMYMDAAFSVFGLIGSRGPFGMISAAFVIALVGAAYGIANEKRWGYWLGVGMAGFNVLFVLALGALLSLGMLFAVAKLALLVHPQSYEYQKLWFR